ncbi:MAG: hypothetical protein ACREO0_15055 [Pseudoxanthomonas sp.]
MINEADLKQYHRALALYCLQTASEPMTAGDCAELMQTTAMGAMHADPCWKRIDAGKVAGTLKALTNQGFVMKAPQAKNARAGRMQERWVIDAATPRQALPDCPDFAPPATPKAAPVAADPYDGLSRAQLLALLQVHGDIAECIARFKAELASIENRALGLLAAAGLEPAA